MDTAYIETTVIGNIAGRLHPDSAIRVRQEQTRNWWKTVAAGYRLFTSQIALDECGEGDSSAAAERLEVVKHVELLDVNSDAKSLANSLMDDLAVPSSQPRDALHIAVAAVHQVEFILTWNFKHILNPHLQMRIADVCRKNGYRPPVICTPQQLLESDDDPRPQ